MTDAFSKKTRSKIMSSIRGKNTSPELSFRKALFRKGYRYSLNYRFKELNFKPDIVLVSRKTCIFIDGCFWHKCPKCFRAPKSNRRYWEPKIKRNVERDRQQDAYLKKHEWQVIRVWEHKIKDDLDRTIRRMCKQIAGKKNCRSKKSARPILKPLPKSANIDKNIKLFIDRLRIAGFNTFGSCSATRADHRVNPKKQSGSDYPCLWIELPKGVVKYGKCFYIDYSDFRKKDVYRKLKRIGRESGWLIHFVRRKKYLTPMAEFILYNKIKPSDESILKAWEKLTRNLERV